MFESPFGVYSNLYYISRWFPLKRRGLGWPTCNKLYADHNCIASCGLIDSQLEIVLDMRGCNLDCKYCWCWKMRQASGIKKAPHEVVRDILCRIHQLALDNKISKSKYRFGVLRITGNEPLLQWGHLTQLMLILNDKKQLEEIYSDAKLAEILVNSKLIIETNGVLSGMRKIDFYPLLKLKNLKIDIDVSFKGVNPAQFNWLTDRPKGWFHYQIEGFRLLFDFAKDNRLKNIGVNPVLGINHEPNYCLYFKEKRYIMEVEIIDEKGERLDFEDYSKDFLNIVLSRKKLRIDEAPFREYSGINSERTKQVVAVRYMGKRYLHMLPSEILKLEGNNP